MSKRKAETLQDEQIVCKDCNSAFTFSVREQTAFAAKGFQAKVRCADCTKAKKVRAHAPERTRGTRTANSRGAQAPQHGALALRVLSERAAPARSGAARGLFRTTPSRVRSLPPQ